MSVIPRMKKGRRPNALSLALAIMRVGDVEMMLNVSKDRVRSTIQARTTHMNTQHPERRFRIEHFGPGRTRVTRLEDVVVESWVDVWARALEIEAGAERIGRSSWTYVLATHGFAVWAAGEGLGVVDRGVWGWEHTPGWKAQQATQAWLRKNGVPARTWR